MDKRASAPEESDNPQDINVMSQTSTSAPSTIVDLEIQDIEGVGPTTARKLKEAGIVSVMDLAVASSDELAVDINSSKETAQMFIAAAQKLLNDTQAKDEQTTS